MKIVKWLLRLLWLVPITSFGTLLFFAYRYLWFSTETIPPERVFVGFILMVIGFFACCFLESEILDKLD